ncbi:MAG: hypothetical protein LBI37_02265, partial [Puniceicoccales bacterium]|nr:hypothetical protein [Puniceicoccales bacterium]
MRRPGIVLPDRLLILQNAYYSVISPEGCAAILWKDKNFANEAAEALQLHANKLVAFGVADYSMTTMCGIIGHMGYSNASQVVIDGLGRLEYRGYDSAGLTRVRNRRFMCLTKVAKVGNLVKAIENLGFSGNIGIGHTRWATHGVVSEVNEHPQLTSDGL